MDYSQSNIERMESKWLDPDYDMATRRYLSDEEREAKIDHDLDLIFGNVEMTEEEENEYCNMLAAKTRAALLRGGQRNA